MIKKNYTFLIPCKTRFRWKKNTSKGLKRSDELRINPDAIVRIVGNTSLIILGLFKAFWINMDIEKEKNFFLDKKKVKDFEYSVLINNDILTKYDDKNKYPIIKKYNECLDAYYAALEITDNCNCYCPHCYGAFWKNKTKKPVSLSLLKKRISKLEKFGIIYLEITGGEPTLRKDLDKITRYVLNKKMKYCIPTNAISVSEDNFESFKNADSVIVSLDGNREFHDKYRGVKGCYDKAINLLKELRKFGVKTYISFTMFSSNVKYVPHIIEVSKKVKAQVIFQRVLGNDHSFSLEETNIKFPKNSRYKTIKPPKEKNAEYLYFGCNMGIKDIFIKTNGDVLPCIYMRYKTLGNIDNITLKNLKNEIKKLRMEKQIFVKCNNCKYNKVCGGPCRYSKLYSELKSKLR